MSVTPSTVEEYYVFLASPGDVNPERQEVRRFFDDYNKSIAFPRKLRFTVIDWENYSTAGVGRPQELITSQTLERCRDHLALVIGIMGQRFGSPSGTHESGTVEEFEWAMQSRVQTGWPEIKWFFRNVEKFEAPSDLEKIQEAFDQWKKLRTFRHRLEEEKGLFFREFTDTGSLGTLLRQDLSAWLSDPERPWAKTLLSAQTPGRPQLKQSLTEPSPNSSEGLLQIASKEEIYRYDPHVGHIEQMAESVKRGTPPSLLLRSSRAEALRSVTRTSSWGILLWVLASLLTTAFAFYAFTVLRRPAPPLQKEALSKPVIPSPPLPPQVEKPPPQKSKPIPQSAPNASVNPSKPAVKEKESQVRQAKEKETATGPVEMEAEPMVLIPAGEFWRGCNEEVDKECDENEKPGRMVYLDAFAIDRYEVTVADYRRCVKAGACSIEGLTVGGVCNWNEKDRARHPINCVNWTQAQEYCAWAGKRLPTEAEWEKAARGTDGRVYPWGNEWDSTKANVAGGGTVPVGSLPTGASPYGVQDMAGNVWEWTADWYSNVYYQNGPARDPPGPENGQYRSVRGGSWDTLALNARASNRDGYGPGNRYDLIGARCAQ